MGTFTVTEVPLPSALSIWKQPATEDKGKSGTRIKGQFQYRFS
jgi:hypothetical protein